MDSVTDYCTPSKGQFSTATAIELSASSAIPAMSCWKSSPPNREIIAEEQAEFRVCRRITEHIFNLRILCEKYLQHQQNLFYVFIGFKKALDSLWVTIRKYNIGANLVHTNEQLYDKATTAVQMNGSTGDWFRTTVGLRQGCLLSPSLFNIFLERLCLILWKNRHCGLLMT